ncbi:MAG: hypothetical protein LBV38_05930 [Alistipes sp.]|jgi:outer membrane protein OmpA-like peptidoglycan-associated protein|nr:hypothetical protein [Alistipes sp.]
MKNIIIRTLCLATLCLASATAASAAVSTRTAGNGIRISGGQISVSGDEMQIAFDVEIDRRAARSGYTLVYRPFVGNGSARWTLPEIVVQSRRARIARDRRLWVSGEEVIYDDPRFVRNGDKFRYTASIPMQPWMTEAALTAETIEAGCCSSSVSPATILANIADFMPAAPAPEPAPMIETPAPQSTGDMLAETLKWVIPFSKFDGRLTAMMFDEDRNEALRVYFPQGSDRLNPYGDGNANVLGMLLSVVSRLQASTDSRVAQIVVAGFASPEGSFELNDRLAYNRAAALRQYIADNSDIDLSRVYIHNGSEDWAGLRAMVEASDMPRRQQVLEIIDSVPVWDARGNSGRESALKQLDGGRTYNYMSRNFFPELRKAAYIKVFYEDR